MYELPLTTDSLSVTLYPTASASQRLPFLLFLHGRYGEAYRVYG